MYNVITSLMSSFRVRSRTPKKPKSKKVLAEGGVTAGPSKTVAKEEGTKEHPISLLGEDKTNKKRKNYTVIEDNGKKRKVVDLVRHPNHVIFCAHSHPARLSS
jgi:hypothetical protein